MPAFAAPYRGLSIGLLVAAILVAGLGGGVVAVGLWLSQPARAVVGPVPDELRGAEPVAMRSASGSLLRGWWLAGADPGRGVVVLLHGVRGNRLSLVRRAATLHAHGFAVLLFDLQAHGESSGGRITFGRLEALDAGAAVAYARSRAPAARIGAIGISLGGAACLLGPEPLPVDALVLESVYPDILTALSDRLRASLGPLIGPLFTPILVPAFQILLPPILGVRPQELRPIDRIAGLRSPVLVASGTADRHTRLAEAEALFERAPQPKRFWAVQGAGHVDLEQYDPDQYWRTIMPFLVRYLTPDNRPGSP